MSAWRRKARRPLGLAEHQKHNQVADIGVDGQGKYTCIATNAEGSMEKTVDVEVIHIDFLLS